MNDSTPADIRAVTIDLDDTLWPIDPVIVAAESALYGWLCANCPKIAHSHTVESMRDARLSIAAKNADIAHDVTEVRRRSLEQFIVEEGAYPDEFVNRAMEVFLEHRNRVSFFPDALPFLLRVSASIPVLSISNGNADLKRVGLSDFLVTHISAIDVGAAKPDSKPFQAACDYLELAPENILHIGDHPIHDILGAARLGMYTVWVNRTDATWEEEHRADHVVTSLEQVLDLLPLHSPGDPE